MNKYVHQNKTPSIHLKEGKNIILQITYGENFPSTNLKRPISYIRIGVPSHIWKGHTTKFQYTMKITIIKIKLQGKLQETETYIPDYSSSIIPSTHSNSRVERMNIQNIGLPRIQQ